MAVSKARLRFVTDRSNCDNSPPTEGNRLPGIAMAMASGSLLGAADDEGLDETVLRKPDLPKAPKPLDLRKVKNPTTRAAKEAAHKVAVAEYMEKKREYDEVLYPAYQKEYQRAYDQSEQRKRQRQREQQQHQQARAEHAEERLEQERQEKDRLLQEADERAAFQ